MINDLAKKVIEAVKQVDKKTTSYDTTATVKRVEGNTAWVHIPGGVDETPVKLTIAANEGDDVQVRVSGGQAWLQGNATAPPTDDATAIAAGTVAREAQMEAQRAGIAADAAEQSATAAKASATAAHTAAVNAQESADNALVSLSTVEDVVGVLNWITAHGTMTPNGSAAIDPAKVYFIRDNNGDYEVGGYKYAIVSEPKADERTSYYTLSVDESVQNYVATHVVVNSEGLWLIPDSNGSPTSNGKKILIATGNGSTYTDAGTYIIDRSSGTDHVYAKFLANGATMTAGDGTQLANLGYGTAIDEHGYTGTFPYYTLGKRQANTQVGAFSMAEGKETEAVAFASHAEGFATTVTSAGENGHAEGNNTTVSGIAGHAEGQETTASGDFSHAEGFETTASGTQAHAGGYYTEAAYANQFVIGKYNDNKSGDLFEIGNGAANARKNVFEVDSSGNVNIASGAKYKINGAVCVSPEVINHYGICTSAAGSQKTVTVTPAITELTAGLTIQVYFNATNTISNPTLDVNGTGAKRIAGNGGSYIGTTTGTSWPAGTLVTLTYDGSYWVVNNFKNTVTGVKGDSELTYRTGNVNLTAANVGALPISGGTMTSDGQIINGHITNSASRETTPDLTPTGKRGITALLASSTMTTNRPVEGTIIHCEWDNNDGWNSQLFIADNDSGNGKPFVAVRGQRSGTWTAWDKLLSESTAIDYVTVQSQSSTSYGDGVWRWREWNSGKVEIWYHGYLTLTSADSDRYGVKRYSRWFNFPNSYSLYRCSAIVNGMNDGGWYGCGGLQNASSQVAEPYRKFQVMSYRISTAPPAQADNLNIYICGQKSI